jgi:hypothetical protein
VAGKWVRRKSDVTGVGIYRWTENPSTTFNTGKNLVMMINSAEYREHRIFSELEHYIKFYGNLSMSVSIFITLGINAICNIDSHFYSSLQGTLESIGDVLKKGRIGDAYALLRKYYDSAVMNIYVNLYLRNNFSIENATFEEIHNLFRGEESPINDWFHGQAQLPDYGKMRKYINDSDNLTTINALINTDDRYKEIKDRCNDYVHYNFFKNVLRNDDKIFLRDRIRLLNAFSEDTRDIFIFHLAYLFFLNEAYMMDSYYMDSIECGVEPEPDTQYKVAPFVKSIIDDVLSKERPDIVSVIKQHSAMHFS